MSQRSPDPNWQQPSDTFAEAAIIAEVLERPEVADLLVGNLTPEDLFDERNRWILAGVLELHKGGTQISVSAVCGWLQQNGRLKQVQSEYLAEIVNCTPSCLNVTDQARRVRDMARLRRCITTARKIATTGERWTGDVQQFLQRAEGAIHEIADDSVAEDSLVTVRKALENKFRGWMQADKENPGIQTGLVDLDEVLGRLRPGSLTYVAARPGVGKSALACNTIAINGAKKGAVVIFSLEMNECEVTDRQLSALSNVPVSFVHDGNLRDDHMGRVTEACETLAQLPIWIDDRAGVGTLDIRSKSARVASEAKRTLGVGLACIVVDYLQLIAEPTNARTRDQAVGANSRELKKLAKDMQVPIVCLSQLSRANEKGNRAPILSDLRESGSIEADADKVLFLHGDEDDEHVREAIVAKNRGGPRGKVKLHWTGYATRFDNLAKE